jgi:hypothetical protein
MGDYVDSLTEIRKNRVKKKPTKKYYTKEELDRIFDRWTEELAKIWNSIYDLAKGLEIIGSDVLDLQRARTGNSVLKHNNRN